MKITRKKAALALLFFAPLIVAVGSLLLPRHVALLVTDEGFSPEDIVIPVGSEVTWTNISSRPVWPASDPHPIHTAYPSNEKGCIGSAFDACDSILPNQTFSFKFEKAGIWGVHDHLNPADTMTIEVAPRNFHGLWTRVTSLFPRGKAAMVKGDQLRAMSHRDAIATIKLLGAREPDTAWNLLKAAYIENGATVDNVHDLAHIVGNSLYEKFGIYGVTHCDAAFAYGCFHGVTQAMLIKGGPGGVKGIEAECTRIFPPNVSSNWTGCIHGLGHGLLSWASLDVAKALAECDTLDSIHRPYCYDGVFMENAEGAPLSDLRPDRPWAFCENFSETYHYNCARYQTPLLMQRFHWDDKTTAESCTLTDDPTLQRGCVETFGHIAAQRNFTSAAGIAAMCGLLSSEETEALCIINAVRELHFQKYQGASLVGEQLCATISLTKRAECYNENR